jgi:hypothetical protein
MVDEIYGFLFIKYKPGILEKNFDYATDNSRFQRGQFESVTDIIPPSNIPETKDTFL